MMRTMSGGPCPYDCTNRNSFGYCKTTACINPKYSNIGTAQYGQDVQKRIVTNADRIRNMSDEELEDFLDRWGLGDIDYSKTFCDMCDGQYDCHECRLDWLKKEAECWTEFNARNADICSKTKTDITGVQII